jgi:hypothetical protein
LDENTHKREPDLPSPSRCQDGDRRGRGAKESSMNLPGTASCGVVACVQEKVYKSDLGKTFKRRKKSNSEFFKFLNLLKSKISNWLKYEIFSTFEFV